jgi:hypothetical protein
MEVYGGQRVKKREYCRITSGMVNSGKLRG